jgi:hypothetical protein
MLNKTEIIDMTMKNVISNITNKIDSKHVNYNPMQSGPVEMRFVLVNGQCLSYSKCIEEWPEL